MATIVNASYTADATPKYPSPAGTLQVLHYQIDASAGTIDGGDVVILDRLPPWDFRNHMTIARLSNDAASALTGDLGYGTYDGTTYTAVDADQFASNINLETEGPTIYYPPDADAIETTAGDTLNYVLALTLDGAGTNFTFVAELDVVISPV